MSLVSRSETDASGGPGRTGAALPDAQSLPATHSKVAGLARALLKAPVHAYRWTLKPLMGNSCRHLPTCSEYALQAIDANGAWRGGWLAISRICRCQPWGSAGYDPVPDLSGERHRLAPWRYGRWSRTTSRM